MKIERTDLVRHLMRGKLNNQARNYLIIQGRHTGLKLDLKKLSKSLRLTERR